VAEAAFGPMGRYVAGMLAYVDMFALIIGSMLLTAHSFMVLIKIFMGQNYKSSY